MKKIFLFLCLICLFVTGCGKQSEKEVLKEFNSKVNNANSYYLSGKMELVNNEDVYNYNIQVSYKKDDNYKSIVMSPGVVRLFNGIVDRINSKISSCEETDNLSFASYLNTIRKNDIQDLDINNAPDNVEKPQPIPDALTQQKDIQALAMSFSDFKKKEEKEEKKEEKSLKSIEDMIKSLKGEIKDLTKEVSDLKKDQKDVKKSVEDVDDATKDIAKDVENMEDDSKESDEKEEPKKKDSKKKEESSKDESDDKSEENDESVDNEESTDEDELKDENNDEKEESNEKEDSKDDDGGDGMKDIFAGL